MSIRDQIIRGKKEELCVQLYHTAGQSPLRDDDKLLFISPKPWEQHRGTSYGSKGRNQDSGFLGKDDWGWRVG